MGTCAQEKHLIAPVSRIYLVHGDSGEPIGSSRADDQGPPLQGVHGLVHERVAAHEVNHFIGVVLGGLHGRRERSSRALQARDERQASRAICEKLNVLDYGRMLASGDPQTVIKDPKVVRAYLGD